MRTCDTCKNQHTDICLRCFVLGGVQTYPWYEKKDNQEILKEVKQFYDNLSKEEFKQRLIKAGFEVEDGNGEIIFTDEELD